VKESGHLLMHPLGGKKGEEVTTAIILVLWPFVRRFARFTTL